MKKLLIVSALALGLSFPLTSHAEVSAFGVKVPVKKAQVSDNLRGGYVAQSSSDTLVVQKLHNNYRPRIIPRTNESKKYSYAVFGVRVPVNSEI